ncbi:MAG TPA: RNA pyrophosphohydrolase [Gammaproteobacteria bacterium]|nr:RNA pyrophosphohydrolase [Gammaproteobacteria bacterium]|tara:strand:- start:3708 stop:4196 length:489 start_codon:yes stop_codon:yes gene_type:complete
MSDLIFDDGYRANVGIVICNPLGKVFFAKRRYQSGWQFPQGGIKEDESPKKAMWRELLEETGLKKRDTKLIKISNNWYQYNLPKKNIRKNGKGALVVGQRQKWFLLAFNKDSQLISLDQSPEQEFDSWKWIDPEKSINQVIGFKKEVYKQVIDEFIPFIKGN